MSSKIKSIHAREIYATRGYVGLHVTVETYEGIQGIATPMIGVSVGKYEAKFLFDGGKRWFGRGVLKAVNNVNKIIAPALKNKDVTQQGTIDNALIQLDGTPDKSHLGANAIVGVSLASLMAAAQSSRVPLYQYLGGVNARVLPCPIIGCGTAGTYRNPGQTRLFKPSFEFAAFDGSSFSESVYLARLAEAELKIVISREYGARAIRRRNILSMVADDRDALIAMTTAIDNTGYTGKIGIFIDCAAGCYYDAASDTYHGLFSDSTKTRDDLMELYDKFVTEYPVIVLEDPLHEDDFEGHALLTKELGIEIVGDDLFVTNPQRLQKGIELGAANAMVLKIPQVGTVTEALRAAQLAQNHGYSVGPCASRGGAAYISDFAVGLNTGQVRNTSNLNRLLEIEHELGAAARFLGRASFQS
jgi:enolase